MGIDVMTEVRVDVATVTMPAGVLRDLIVGALVAAGKDDTLPTLTCVQLTWTDRDSGPVVTTAATDRYRLATGRTEGTAMTATGDGQVLIPRRDADALVKLLPKSPTRGKSTDDVTVTLDGSTARVTLHAFGQEKASTSFRSYEGTFLKWESLIPTGTEGTEGISFNPEYMAAVAKIPHARNVPVSWVFKGSTRPAVASYETHNGIDWRYLLMPVRLNK